MDSKRKRGPVIMPEQTLLEPAHQKKWENTLIGKVHTPSGDSVPYHVISEDINKAWSDHLSPFTMLELDDGLFGIHFHDKKDMKWVMDSRPWLIDEDQYLLVLTEWCPNTPPSKIKFSDSYPFWVQVHDIPYEYMSKEMGKKIGEGTGHVVLDVDLDEENNTRMKYLRIRVLVDITVHLVDGCWLLISKDKPYKVLWLPFQFEELPMVCKRCGLIGYPTDICTYIDEDEDEDDSSDGVGQESELPAVLVEGQVLSIKVKKAHGPWIYEGTYEDKDGECVDFNDLTEAMET